MKKTATIFLVAVLVLAFTSQAQAAVGIYFGLQGGWAQETASFSNITFNTDSSFLYGVKAGIRIFTLAVEVNYYQVAHNLDPSNPVDTFPARKVDYNYAGINVRWILPLLFLNPYLTGGYGYYSADIQSIDTKRDGGFNIGAGLEIMLGRRFAVAAEGKYQKVKIAVSGATTGTLSSGQFTVSGGLNFYF
ncbi:MAG: outer membrane beta-barrel protein [Candidatus Aminicenantales bacterium]